MNTHTLLRASWHTASPTRRTTRRTQGTMPIVYERTMTPAERATIILSNVHTHRMTGVALVLK